MKNLYNKIKDNKRLIYTCTLWLLITIFSFDAILDIYKSYTIYINNDGLIYIFESMYLKILLVVGILIELDNRRDRFNSTKKYNKLANEHNELVVEHNRMRTFLKKIIDNNKRD